MDEKKVRPALSAVMASLLALADEGWDIQKLMKLASRPKMEMGKKNWKKNKNKQKSE